MNDKKCSSNGAPQSSAQPGENAPGKPLPWFRLYTEIIDDDKLGLVAFEDRWHYVAILACKGRGLLDKGDRPELMLRRIGLKLGLAARELDEVVRRLAEVGLIDRETLQPLAWDNRQMRSDTDPTATNRKRRQREKSKVTGMSRVTGTDVTRTDTDTDIEEEAEETSPPTGGEEGGIEGDGGGADDQGNGKTPPKPKGKGEKSYPEEFEAAWAAYPKRSGGNSKADAHAAWNARRRAGVTVGDLLAGVERYAAYVRAEGKEFTAFVKQGATFFGPGEHWSAEYAAPAGAGTAKDGKGRVVAATSQQRNFAGTDYGQERVPGWMEDLISDAEASKAAGSPA